MTGICSIPSLPSTALFVLPERCKADLRFEKSITHMGSRLTTIPVRRRDERFSGIILTTIVYNYARFALNMRNGCLDQVAVCGETNRTQLADLAIWCVLPYQRLPSLPKYSARQYCCKWPGFDDDEPLTRWCPVPKLRTCAGIMSRVCIIHMDNAAL